MRHFLREVPQVETAVLVRRVALLLYSPAQKYMWPNYCSCSHSVLPRQRGDIGCPTVGLSEISPDLSKLVIT